MVLLRSLVNINCGYKMRCSQRAGVSWHYHRHGTDLGSLCACRCCGWAPPQPRSVATGSPQVGVSRCALQPASRRNLRYASKSSWYIKQSRAPPPEGGTRNQACLKVKSVNILLIENEWLAQQNIVPIDFELSQPSALE